MASSSPYPLLGSVRWFPTLIGILKFSFDGNAVGNPGLAGIVVIHDNASMHILSFQGRLGIVL